MAAEPVAEKEGVLFVATDSKAKKPKPFLLRLYGSSLYAYRLRPEGKYGTAVKWCLQLNDALFDERRGTDSFAITYFNKNYVFMTAPDASLSKRKSASSPSGPSEDHPAEWLPYLKAAMQREPVQLPKDKSIAFKTKKGIMSSSMGQSILSKVLDKRAKNILKSLRKIVSIMYNSKYAEALEKKIIKLIVISYFHYESGKLDQEGIATIESYLRRALKTVLIVVVNYHKITNETQRVHVVRERLEEVVQSLNDTTMFFKRLLEQFCDKKELMWVDAIYGAFADVEKLQKALNDKNAQEPLNVLIPEIKEYLGWDASGVDNLVLIYGTPKGGFGF